MLISGILIPWAAFWFPKPRILDSTKKKNSGFWIPPAKISWNLDSHTWSEVTVIYQTFCHHWQHLFRSAPTVLFTRPCKDSFSILKGWVEKNDCQVTSDKLLLIVLCYICWYKRRGFDITRRLNSPKTLFMHQPLQSWGLTLKLNPVILTLSTSHPFDTNPPKADHEPTKGRP